MTFDLLRTSRWIALMSMMALAAPVASGCMMSENGIEYREADESTYDEVTDVSHSVVKRQSIGNCWIYATTGWIESMRLRQANETLNVSESYLTYWDWYQKIQSGEFDAEGIQTGGHWGEAANIIRARGLMMEADFIPEEANAEISTRQSTALAAINLSLKSGVLSSATARRDRLTVRAELNKAFGLNAAVVAELDRVFKADGSRTISNFSGSLTTVRRASSLVVGSAKTSSGSTRDVTLLDAMGTERNSWNPDQRRGSYAWQGVSYPSDAAGRKALMTRVLKALNDGHPVLISWLVDFNALDAQGAFRMEALRTPGRQGGHLTVLEDYVVDNVPGLGTLGLGQLPPEQRAAALNGTVRFLRIKNSWGASRSDRASQAGYYDLYMNYLNGPITWKVEGSTSTTNRTPFSSVVLPPGY